MWRNFAIVATASSVSFFLGNSYTEWKENFPLVYRVSKAATALVTPPQPFQQLEPVPRPKDLSSIEEPWAKPSRAKEIMRYGYPGFDNLRTYDDFVLSYDRRTRTAHWVMEHLSPDRMVYDPSVDRSKCEFRADESIHPYFRSLNEDYKRSGYDRGHLSPAGNHRMTQRAMDQTFFLSNMSPQVGKGFNRDKWNDLEKHARRYARRNPNVYICTGPLYLPHAESDGLYVKYKVIGKSHVAVPTHFFKVVLIETEKDGFELEAFLLPNQEIPNEKLLSDFLVPLDSIERAAGFLIFHQFPKEKLKKINGKKTGGLLW
uniref:Endonuclease n=1 Tax=Acrobeloides nanus TaxID=290746 RepID=A0A914D6Y9_9BILA